MIEFNFIVYKVGVKVRFEALPLKPITRKILTYINLNRPLFCELSEKLTQKFLAENKNNYA
jgi:hypothetical protein